MLAYLGDGYINVAREALRMPRHKYPSAAEFWQSPLEGHCFGSFKCSASWPLDDEVSVQPCLERGRAGLGPA